jgi:putative membrane protein
MIIEIIIALIIGICAGTLTGLIPGIHINLISFILLGFSASLLNFTEPIILSIFIISMAITHTFTDFIPSIFLGAPDEDSVLSILPGHKLLLKGRGHYAVILTLYGSLSALIIFGIFLPFFMLLLPKIYPYIQKIMWLILIIASAYLIITEKNKRILALVIFLLAGFLGVASLNLNLKEPLLPLLTGLFGASNLLVSIQQKTKLPPQKIEKLKNIRISKKSFLKFFFGSIIAAPFTAFLPGLGASQAALIGKEVSNVNSREFLLLLGAINTLVMALSFIAVYSINRTRTGAAVALSQLIPSLKITDLLLIILAIFSSGVLAFFISIEISKKIAKNIHRIKYSAISKGVLIVLIMLVIIFSGPLGFLIFITSASLGVFAISSGIRRIQLMGCLLFPTILFYLV